MTSYNFLFNICIDLSSNQAYGHAIDDGEGEYVAHHDCNDDDDDDDDDDELIVVNNTKT